MSGRKTDVNDADWLRFLGSCNLIRPCFQIAAVSRRLREYHRIHASKVRDMARELQHMQKAMGSMNIKLDSVISDIAGKSGMSIMRAMLNGERNPATLASLTDPHCKNDKATIEAALQGTWDIEHMLALRMAMETYDHLQTQIVRIEKEMEIFLDSYELTPVPSVKASDIKDNRSGKRKQSKNPIHFDVELYSFLMYGVNLMRIPGVSDSTLITLMCELGPDFTSKFKTPGKFCRWCNLTPVDNVTGGMVTSSKVPKRPNPVGQALRQAASTLRKSDTPLGQYRRRMAARLGPAQAVVATAHKIAEIIYLMVERKVEYDESKTDSLKRNSQNSNRLKIHCDYVIGYQYIRHMLYDRELSNMFITWVMILKFKRVFTVRRGAFDFYEQSSGKLFEPEQKFVENFTKNEACTIFRKIVVSNRLRRF